MSDISMLKAFEKNAEATKYWVNNQINPVKENIEEVEKRVSALENSSLEYTTTTSSGPALINNQNVSTLAVLHNIGGNTYNAGNILPFNERTGWTKENTTDNLNGITINYVREPGKTKYKNHTFSISGKCNKQSEYYVFRISANNSENYISSGGNKLRIRISPALPVEVAPIVGYYSYYSDGTKYDDTSHAWNGYNVNSEHTTGILPNGKTYIEYDVVFGQSEMVRIHSIRLRFNLNDTLKNYDFNGQEYAIAVGYKNSGILDFEYPNTIKHSYVQKINEEEIISKQIIERYPWLAYGVGSKYNYIDFDSKKAYKVVELFLLKDANIITRNLASASWRVSTFEHQFTNNNNEQQKIKSVVECSSEYLLDNKIYYNGAIMFAQNGNIHVGDIYRGRTSLTEAVALKDWGNYIKHKALWALCELETPEIYDLSDLLDTYQSHRIISLAPGENPITTNNTPTPNMPYQIATIALKLGEVENE